MSSHLIVLGISVSILLTALTLTTSGSQLRLGQMNLPPLCVLRQTTGLPCPGCGLSRSVVAAAHGNWSESFTYHRLGGVFLLFLVLQALYRLAWLGLPRLRATVGGAGRFLDMAIFPLMILLFINWIPTLMSALGFEMS